MTSRYANELPTAAKMRFAILKQLKLLLKSNGHILAT